MNKFKKYMLLAVAFLVAVSARAQEVPSADLMRSNGKIFVVVAVVVTILVGLFIYVFAIDRKLSRLEKGETFK
ncbi:MAG: CcmD family protein [Sediminibacterium sp.]